jgi:hypothetical protein
MGREAEMGHDPSGSRSIQLPLEALPGLVLAFEWARTSSSSVLSGSTWGFDGAEDGIRTRDAHLGKVMDLVHRVPGQSLACSSVHPVSTSPTTFAPVVERSTLGFGLVGRQLHPRFLRQKPVGNDRAILVKAVETSTINRLARHLAALSCRGCRDARPRVNRSGRSSPGRVLVDNMAHHEVAVNGNRSR